MKSMIKRIIVGVAIALIVGMLSGCNVVHAKVSSVTFNQGQYYLPNGSNTLQLPLGQVFTGLGNGGVIFNFLKPFDNYQTNEIINIYINRADGVNLTCEYVRNTIDQDTTAAGDPTNLVGGYFYYQVNCPIDTTYYGLSNIIIKYRRSETQTGGYREYINNMNYVTFYSIADFNSTELINTLNNNNTDLKSFLSTQNYYIRNDLTNIYSLLNSNNQELVGKIQQQIQTQQETNNKIQETNDFLTDTSAPSSSDMDFSSSNSSNGVISDLVTMPIRLVQSFLNGFNSSCTPFNLGNLLGTDLVLPCINIGSKLGAVWTIIDTIISGLFIYVFGKSCVKKFNDITNMKENQIDEVFD